MHHETGIEIEAVALAVVERQLLVLERIETAEFHAAKFDVVEIRVDQIVDILLEAIDPAIACNHAVTRRGHRLVVHFQIRPRPMIEAHQHSGGFRLVGNYPEIEPAADLVGRIVEVEIETFAPMIVVVHEFGMAKLIACFQDH